MATQTLGFVVNSDPRHRWPALDDAVRSLVSSSFVLGRFRIQMPLILPSGSSVVVTIWPEGNGDTFMVTDDGVSLFEITGGAFSETLFGRVAKEFCSRYGASFDGGSMLYLRVGAGRLRGAIIAMANLIKEVVDETVGRSIEQKAKGIDLELWEKLDYAFKGFKIDHKANLAGESSATHQFSAVVNFDRGIVVFDTFNGQGNSINAAYTKMADLGRTEHPPRRIAVTRLMHDIGPKLNLITSVATVVEIGIENDSLRRLAFAA